MSTEEERLVVSLEARIRDFERNFQRANRTSNQNFKAIEAQAKRSADALEKSMSNAAKGMNVALAGLKGGIAGLVAGLSVGALGGIVSRFRDITREVANIGSEAKRAGLSTKAFQELGYVAQQNRIPIDALTDGMKELSLRADEFIITGQGSAAEAFQRLGYGAADLKRKLADPSALLVDIIGKLEHLDRAAQIRIADELFGGTGGERFVELLDRGAVGIRQLVKEANELGLVLDDAVVQRADEIDRKFSQITSTVGTALKKAVVDVVGSMDDWLDRMNRIEEQTTRNVQSQLLSTYDKLREAKDLLSDLQLDKGIYSDDPTIDLNIDRQKQLIEELTSEAMRLRDILDRRNGYSENFVYKAGNDAKDAKTPLDNLNNCLSGTGTAAGNAATGINSYSDAIRALKNEVPELSRSLAELDAKTRIDAVYRQAISRAQGQREIALANEMRGKALSSLNIKSATDDPSTYLSTALTSGKDRDHINGMADAFASKLAKMLASMPDNLRGQISINSGYRSPEHQQELWLQALQKYGSPEAARKWVAPPGNSQHNKGNAADLGYGSDAARQWAHQNAGNFGLSFPMGHEPWHIEDEDARSSARSAEIERQTTALTEQANAYRQIVTEAQQFTTEQQTEQQALSMTGRAAAAYRYEQQMLAEAQRQGIPLTSQQRQEIQQLAQGMAQAEAATQQYAMTQEEARQVSGFFASTAGDALTGLIMGTTTAEQALQQLIASLAQAVLQAALLGEGPLAGVLGGGSGKGGGGLLGGLFGALFGLKDGGFVSKDMSPLRLARGGHVSGPGGPRDDKVPAYLSDGEFVVNAAATRKNRAALEAINRGAVPRLADGSAVGRSLSAGGSGGGGSVTFAPTTQITVQGAGGSAEDQKALGDQLAAKVNDAMDAKMNEFMAKQMRSGGSLNRYGFG